MIDATIGHLFLSLIHTVNVITTVVSKLLYFALASRDLIANAAVRTSKHEKKGGLRPPENRLSSPLTQQDMYRHEWVFIFSSLSAYRLGTPPADFC